jgi:limonene-1,2-epoxide hydrolase
MNKPDALDKVKRFYEVFDKKHVDSLEDIYSESIIFVDPFHQIEGIQSLKAYFGNLANNINYCRFHFKHEAVNNDDIFLQWRMEFSHPNIKKGLALELDGVSHLVVREKIIYHRDYFDSVALLYRHIPLLGSVIRQIEKNMGT